MSKGKSLNSSAANTPLTPSVRGHGTVADMKKPVKPVEGALLEIDEDNDFGGDPYNHTGSYCVVKLGEP